MNINKSKTTLVIGASENPERYSNMAIKLLNSYGHPVRAIGRKIGIVAGIPIEIETKCEIFSQIDTISLYLNPKNQKEYLDFIVCVKPKRVVFNPGTENPDLYDMLDANDIEWEEACTLVLLQTGQF